jgi:hypothetical protein
VIRRETWGAWVGLATTLVVAPIVLEAQEIVQAVVLDLTAIEVQVIVAGTRSDDRVQCLVRDGADRVRTVAERPVSSGFTSGRTTVVSLPLPLLAVGEREFAVVLLREGAELGRTGWRPLR